MSFHKRSGMPAPKVVLVDALPFEGAKAAAVVAEAVRRAAVKVFMVDLEGVRR